MKKIILLLNLIAFTATSQVTPVGGYLPLNSSKSFTAGNATCSNVIARGTFSVGSTATVSGNALFSSSVGIGVLPNNALSVFQSVKGTGSVNIGESVAGFGALWFDTPVSASNYALRGNAANTSINSIQRQQHNINNTTKGVWTSTGLRVGSSSDPTAVLDVTGDAKVSSTFSLGSANLTGGNTGTVAVLSDALFTTTHFHGLATVATSVFFYDKYNSSSGSSSSSGAVGVTYIPFNCTLVGYSLFNGVLGTLGSSSATVAVRVNNTTDVVLNSAVQYTASAQSYSSAALSTTIAAGDYIEIKVTPNNTPTAATNAIQQITLFFARRQ